MSHEKLDVIDLIIHTLKEHENKLDVLIARLEYIINKMNLEDWK